MRVAIPDAAELYERLTARLDDYQVDVWEGRDGEEFYRAACAVAAALLARASERLRARYILQATGAQRASASVRITWASSTVDAYGLRAGQVIAKTPWGVRYYLTEAVERAASEAAGSQDVGIAALWTGFEGNVEAEHISEWALPGGVDPAAQIAWTAGTGAAGQSEFIAGIASGDITIAGLTDATGGADGTLDLIGIGRALPRSAGEGDAAYRARLRALPDVVTPGAIQRVVNAALEPYGLEATIEEPWDYGFAFGHGAFGHAPPSRPWHFIVAVPSLPWDPDGFAFGASAFGRDPFGTGDAERAGFYAGLQAQVDQIKAGGIWAAVQEDTAA